MATKQNNNTTALLRLPDVLLLVGVSKTQLYRLARTGAFPASVRLGPNSVAWPEKQVHAWIESKLSGGTEQ